MQRSQRLFERVRAKHFHWHHNANHGKDTRSHCLLLNCTAEVSADQSQSGESTLVVVEKRRNVRDERAASDWIVFSQPDIECSFHRRLGLIIQKTNQRADAQRAADGQQSGGDEF